MKRENRYIVLKHRDIEKALSDEHIEQLKNICRIVGNYRDDLSKKEFQCVVVESDWPMYEKTWKMIEDYVDKK